MPEKPLRWWDFPAAAFLTIALFASAMRLQTTHWTANLGRTEWLVLIGVFLGLLLGASRFNARLSVLFGLVFTLFFVPWSLASLIRAELWIERLQSLWGRLSTAGGQLLANQPVKDSILVLAFLCLLFWLAAFTAGYQLTRNARPWGGLVAAGVTVLIVDYSFEMYAAEDTGTALSLVFFLFTVILVARIYYLRSHLEWSSRGQLVENEVGFDISRGAAITALVLVLLAWFSPRVVKAFTPGTLESQQLSDRFRELRQRVSNAVSSLESQAPILVESLGDSLTLGRGTNLSEEVVFTVVMDGGRMIGGRLYWTGRIYDTYIDGRWVSTDTRPNPFGPSFEQPSYSWQGRREVSVEINSRISLLRTLYFPSIPLTISRPVLAEVFASPADEPDITALISDPPISAGETYRVRAAISAPNIEMLRASAADAYPDWVIERYTNLPTDFSPRVAQLAETIAGNLPTPYDQTVAITEWLRQNIRYQTSLPEIPTEVDPIEWFLFDIQEGFCNYYATAEVLMLRSLGIPARMVVGYAEGTWVVETNNYQIAGKDYHAWPEVYFPTIGWVPFEPTAGQPSLSYPNANAAGGSAGPLQGIPTPFIPPTPIDAANSALVDEEAQREANRIFVTTLVGTTSGVTAFGLLVFAIYRWRKYTLKGMPIATWFERALTDRGMRAPRWLVNWSRRVQRTPMESLFARVPEMLRVWGQDPALDSTPAEQVRRLTEIVPELSAYASVLLREYQLATYSNHQANLSFARSAAADLRQKGYQIWFQRLTRIR